MTTKWNARLYNDKHSFVFEYGSALIDMLDLQGDESVLDLGCGTGELTAKIAERAGYTLGMDSSAEMVETASTDYPDVDFLIKDAASFQFDRKFDSIFSNAALHWVVDHREAIRCMYAALKDGGRLVLEFGGKGNVKTITDRLRDSLRARGYGRQADINPWYFPSIPEYTAELEAAGFEVGLARLYDRPTELADGRTGIIDWLSMFAGTFFVDVPQGDRDEILSEVQQQVRPTLFKEGKWYADYRRLRIVAFK